MRLFSLASDRFMETFDSAASKKAWQKRAAGGPGLLGMAKGKVTVTHGTTIAAAGSNVTARASGDGKVRVTSLRGSTVTAGANSTVSGAGKITAEVGSTVIARAGAKVTAKSGSKVITGKGASTVYLPGSSGRAEPGSTAVIHGGAFVYAQPGADITRIA